MDKPSLKLEKNDVASLAAEAEEGNMATGGDE